MSPETQAEPARGRVCPASTTIRALAALMALASLGFAVVNVIFEATGRFEDGPLAEYEAALTIANLFVAALKVLGAGVAVLTVSRKSWMPARPVNVLIWGATGTLGVYSIGGLAQALGLAMGPAGSRAQIDVAGVVYVLGFLIVAVGFAVLAVSHSRRSGLGAGPAVLGTVGGIFLLGFILAALPALLSALGIMPSG